MVVKLIVEEPPLEYIAFMGAIPHDQATYILDTLQEYNIGSYLVSLETSKTSHKETNGEHLHFCVQMNNEDYHKFSKRVFIDKYKLRGKALKDKPRQYGRVKQIENLERMMAYTLKDGNIRTNMTEEQLEQYRKISFKKSELKDEQDTIIEYIKQKLQYREDPKFGYTLQPSRKDIGIIIIEYHRTNKTKKNLTRVYLQNLIFYYMAYHTDSNTGIGITDEDLYLMICG